MNSVSLVDPAGNPIESEKKKELRYKELPPAILKLAAKHGLDKEFPTFQDKAGLRRYISPKFNYIPRDKQKKVLDILGATNNYFAMHLAIREDNMMRLANTVDKLTAELKETTLWAKTKRLFGRF